MTKLNTNKRHRTLVHCIDTVTSTVTGLTVKIVNIKNFSIGIYLWPANKTVTGNAITDGM